MPGLIEFGHDNHGRRYAIYPKRPVVLPKKTKLYAILVTTACVTSTIIAFLGFYAFALYTYGMDEWVIKGDPKKETCLSEFFMFLTPILPFMFGLMVIGCIYSCCFETQVVDCGMVRSYCICFIGIPYFLPLLLALTSSCSIPPISFKLVTFLMCSLFATISFGFWHYAKNHCQCKKCLRIKEVKMQYETQLMLLDERAKLNQSVLTHWFNIASSVNSHLSIQLEDGEIIYTFTRDSPNIQLKPGHYHICVMEMVPVTVGPKPITAKRICEPATTPSSHLISREEVQVQKDVTIMNID